MLHEGEKIERERTWALLGFYKMNFINFIIIPSFH